MAPDLDILRTYANRLRVHSLRSTSEAGSGHPTTCLSAAEIMSALFFYAMRYDPQNADHPNNDRFVLSKGHTAPKPRSTSSTANQSRSLGCVGRAPLKPKSLGVATSPRPKW